MAKCRRHPVVLETPGGIHPLVLQVQLTRIETDIAGDLDRMLQQCLPFADGHHLRGRCKRQEAMKSPDPTLRKRTSKLVISLSNFREIGRRMRSIPVVLHIQ